jgi:transposase
LEITPNGAKPSQPIYFTHWFKTQKRSMRQLHVAGDKLFIDYCGPRLQVLTPDTGEVREAEVFVSILGASNYTYVEAYPSQGMPNWLEAHANAFEHIKACFGLDMVVH